MPQLVVVNGQTVAFPDGMSTDEIAGVIKKNALSIPSAKTPASPSMWDNFKEGAGNLALGTAKGLADPVYGISQLALNAANKGAQAFGSNAIQNTANDYNKFLTDQEHWYQNETAGSIAAGVGRVGGNLAMPVKGAQLLKGASVIPRAINAGVTGAVIGATQPVVGAADSTLSDLVTGNMPNNYWNEKGLQVGLGALAGGSLSAAGSALGGMYNAVKPIVAPRSAAGDILLKGVQKIGADDPGSLGALVNNPTALADRIKAAESLVPGSLPTTAQVAGLPQLVMAEKTLKNNPNYRVAFEDRAIANNAARLAALKGVAQTPEELAMAVEARRSMTAPLYDAANATVHPVDEGLQTILGRPSAQAALARGKKLAAERGEQAGPQAGTPATQSMLVDESGKNFPGLPAVAGSIDGKTLQYLKMGIADLQKEGKVNGMGSHEANALSSTRNDLDSWLVDNSPAFKLANDAYKKASVPINSMEVGQQLYGGLADGTLNAAGDISPALSQYRAKYAQALKASKYGIAPEAQKTLDAIQSDLQRETISNSIRSSGSDTYFNAQSPNWLASKLYGENLDGKSMVGKGLGALTGLLTGGPMGAAGGYVAGQKLGAFAGDRVNTALQDAMLNPELFAKLLKEAAARSAKQSGGGLLSPSLQKAGALGADNSLSGLLSGQ